MRYSENVLNILAAKTFSGIGNAWIVKTLHGGESETKMVNLLAQRRDDEYSVQQQFRYAKKEIASRLEEMESYADGAVAIGDEDFPDSRGIVKAGDRPIVLFYKGNLSLLDSKNRNVAVIGLLNPDESTIRSEQAMVKALVDKGFTIISGLANGCDSVAHQQALDEGGNTVAILPSTLKHILPTGNRKLAWDIVENGGLLLTEYYMEPYSSREQVSRYIERDRLQAQFADAIVLSASYAKNNQGNDSGSRIAMEKASVYGIPRYVIYKPETDADNPKYDLSRQLLLNKEVVRVDDVNLDKVASDIAASEKLKKGQLDLF